MSTTLNNEIQMKQQFSSTVIESSMDEPQNQVNRLPQPAKMKVKELREIVKEIKCINTGLSKEDSVTLYYCFCMGCRDNLVCEECYENCHDHGFKKKLDWMKKIHQVSNVFSRCSCEHIKHDESSSGHELSNKFTNILKNENSCFYNQISTLFVNRGKATVRKDDVEDVYCEVCVATCQHNELKKLKDFKPFFEQTDKKCTCKLHSVPSLISYYHHYKSNLDLNKYFKVLNFNFVRHLNENHMKNKFDIFVIEPLVAFVVNFTEPEVIDVLTSYYYAYSLDLIITFLHKYKTDFQTFYNPFPLDFASKLMRIISVPSKNLFNIHATSKLCQLSDSKINTSLLYFAFYVKNLIEENQNTFNINTVVNMSIIERRFYMKISNKEINRTDLKKFIDSVLNDFNSYLSLNKKEMMTNFLVVMLKYYIIFKFLIKYNLLDEFQTVNFIEYFDKSIANLIEFVNHIKSNDSSTSKEEKRRTSDKDEELIFKILVLVSKTLLYLLIYRNDKTFINLVLSEQSEKEAGLFVFQKSYDNNLASKVFCNILHTYNLISDDLYKGDKPNESNLGGLEVGIDSQNFSVGEDTLKSSNLEKNEVYNQLDLHFQFCNDKILELLIGDSQFYVNSIESITEKVFNSFKAAFINFIDKNNFNKLTFELIRDEIIKNKDKYEVDKLQLSSTQKHQVQTEDPHIPIVIEKMLNDFHQNNINFSDLIINFDVYIKLIQSTINDIINYHNQVYEHKENVTDFENAIHFRPLFKRFNEFFEILTCKKVNSRLSYISYELACNILKFFTKICSKDTIILITSLKAKFFFQSLFFEGESNSEMITFLQTVANTQSKEAKHDNSEFTSSVINSFLSEINSEQAQEDNSNYSGLNHEKKFNMMSSFLSLIKTLISSIHIQQYDVFDSLKSFVDVLKNLKATENKIFKLYFDNLNKQTVEFEEIYCEAFNRVFDKVDYKALDKIEKKENKDQTLTKVDLFKSMMRKENMYNSKFNSNYKSYIKPILDKFFIEYFKFLNQGYKLQLVFFDYFSDQKCQLVDSEQLFKVFGGNFQTLNEELINQFLKFTYNTTIKSTLRYNSPDNLELILKLKDGSPTVLFDKLESNLKEYYNLVKRSMSYFDKKLDNLKKGKNKVSPNFYINFLEDGVLLPVYFLNNIYMMTSNNMKGQSFEDLKSLNFEYTSLFIKFYEKLEEGVFNLEKPKPKSDVILLTYPSKFKELEKIKAEIHELSGYQNEHIIQKYRAFTFAIIKESHVNSKRRYFLKFSNSRNNFFENTFINGKDYEEITKYNNLYNEFENEVQSIIVDEEYCRFVRATHKFKSSLSTCYKDNFAIISIFGWSEISEVSYQQKLFRFLFKKIKESLTGLNKLTYIRNLIYHSDNFELDRFLPKDQSIDDLIIYLSAKVYVPCFIIEVLDYLEFKKAFEKNSFSQEIVANLLLILKLFGRDKEISEKIFDYNLSSVVISRDEIYLNEDIPSRITSKSRQVSHKNSDISFSQVFFLTLRNLLSIINYDEKFIYHYKDLATRDIENLLLINYSDSTRLKSLYFRQAEMINEIINNQSNEDESNFYRITEDKKNELEFLKFLDEFPYYCYSNNLNQFRHNNEIIHKSFIIIKSLLLKKRLNVDFLTFFVTKFDLSLLADLCIQYTKILISKQCLNPDQTLSPKELCRDYYHNYYMNSNFLISVTIYQIIQILSNKHNMTQAKKILYSKKMTKLAESTFMKNKTEFGLTASKTSKKEDSNKFDLEVPLVRKRDYMHKNREEDLSFINEFFNYFIIKVEFVNANEELKQVQSLVMPDSIVVTSQEIAGMVETADYSSASSKMSSFYTFLERMEIKIEYFKGLSWFQKYVFNEVSFYYFDCASFLLSLAINIILLFKFVDPDFFSTDEGANIYYAIVSIGILQLLINSIGVYLFYVSAYGFNVYYLNHLKITKIEDQTLAFKIKTYLFDCFLFESNLKLMLMNIVTCIIGISSPLLTFIFSVQLISVVRFLKTIQEVFMAFKIRIGQVLVMILFLAVIVYFFTNMSFFFLSEEFVQNVKESADTEAEVNVCNRMFECFIFHIKEGIMNGGGVGDKLAKMNWEKDLGQYFKRWGFDLLFFIVCILLVLNMINGIIVNAFGDIRKKDEEHEEESVQKCFICSIPHSKFKKSNVSFEKHKKTEHKIKDYVHYLIYIRTTPDKDLDEFSEYIKKNLEKKEFIIFPNLQTTSMQGQ